MMNQIKSVKSGNWNDPDTWSAPFSDRPNITICTGHTVTLDDLDQHTDSLIFEAGSSLKSLRGRKRVVEISGDLSNEGVAFLGKRIVLRLICKNR